MNMYRAAVMLIFIFVAAMASGQIKARLNDDWDFLRTDLGSVWEAVRPVPRGGAESAPLWQQVKIPHTYNAQDAVDPDVDYYQGPAWYRKRLKVQNPYRGGRTLLHFEGSGQKTDVYIHTKLVGSHIGGYDEFTIDITAAVDSFKSTDFFKKQFQQTVPVSIRTDNSRDVEMMPSSLSDFIIYGGLYRYVNLVYLPSMYLDQVFVNALVDSGGRAGNVSVRASLNNLSNSELSSLRIRVLDPFGKVVVAREIADAKQISSGINIQIDKPLLWSPSTPALYKVEITLGDQVEFVHVGFRHFYFAEQGPFLLNGKRLLLQGTHRHEDHAGVGAAMTEEMMREEMIAIKEMGVNFIRLGHYQQSRIILNLCDSLGLLVWEEIPWCRGGLGNAVYQEQGRRMLKNMISQHYNHPSVILWGLGNENDWPGDFPFFDTTAIRAYMKELNSVAHALDPSRKTAIRRCDFCKDIPDVYSPSIWAGWYRGIYTDYKKYSELEMQKVRHFIHVEWGGDSHAGRHSEKPDDLLRELLKKENVLRDTVFKEVARITKDNNWNETYICNLVDWHLKEQATMPWLTGTAQWPFKDFATPLRPENPVPYVNQKGVVERDGTKKESYYVYQSYWSEKPMVHIYGHSWPVRWGNEGEEKLIRAYSNCDNAELFVNGKSYGRKTREVQDYPAAGLRWNVFLNQGNYLLIVKATKGKAVVYDTVSFRYETRKWGAGSVFEIAKRSEVSGIVTLEATLFDEKGVVCLDSTTRVEFAIAGTGELIKNQGTPSGSGKVELANGRVFIRVRKLGDCVVSVSAKGMKAAFIKL